MLELIPKEIIEACKVKLLTKKAEILNRVRQGRFEHSTRDNGGDEVDQSMSLLAENTWLSTLEKLRILLFEIESALGRIEKGEYGICEITDEPIEQNRLLAIPWTRLSVEGAEVQEEQLRKKARY